MMRTKIIACFSLLLVRVASIDAATVNFMGRLDEETFVPSSPTLSDDFVIAGTFRPGFDIPRYNFIYGDDAGNTHQNHYALAVADGNFRPIGAGTLANAAGEFAGTGSTPTNIDGLPIYIYCFPESNPFGYYATGALFSGTGPSWRILNDGSTSIDTATANIFLLGSNDDGTITMRYLPIPEPQTAISALVVMITLLRRASHERTN